MREKFLRGKSGLPERPVASRRRFPAGGASAVGWALDTVVDPRVAYDQWFGKQPAPGKSGKNG